MSSVKDMIAKMNSKKATPETATPAVTVANPVTSEATKRQSVVKPVEQEQPKTEDRPTAIPTKRPSISERIASIKLAQTTEKGTEPETTQTAEVPKDVTPIVSSTPSNSDSNSATTTPAKRGSIADKIAALQAKPETEKPASPAAATLENTPQKRMSVADKIAALKAKPEPEKTETKPIETTPSKSSSIAEKIAAMKAKPSEPEKTEEKPAPSTDAVTPSKRGSVADKIAAMKAKPVEAVKVEEKPKPSPKSQGIAERIAAMQASSAAASAAAAASGEPSHHPPPVPGKIHIPERVEPTDGESSSKPETTPSSGKRLSIDKMKFAAGINLAGLSPMAPRPMIVKPKPIVEEEEHEAVETDRKSLASGAENGEMQHYNLSRASIRASVRRKGTASTRLTLPLEYGDEVITLPSATTTTTAGIADTGSDHGDEKEPESREPFHHEGREEEEH